jgi:putative membrane protein
MLSAFATSWLFLVCYIWYHAHHGLTHFPRHGAVRDLYLVLLGSHTILAVAKIAAQTGVARWTFPTS